MASKTDEEEIEKSVQVTSELEEKARNICHHCKKECASYHCIECKMAYCNNCMKDHDGFPTLRQHRRHHLDGSDSKHVCSHTQPCSHQPTETCQKHTGKLKSKTCAKCNYKFCEDCYRKHIKQKGCRKRKEVTEASELQTFKKIIEKEGDAMETHNHSRRAVGEGLLAHILNITRVDTADAGYLKTRLQAFIYVLHDKIAINEEWLDAEDEGRTNGPRTEAYFERKRLLNEQRTVVALADFALNESAAPKVMSNIHINIFRRLTELIVDETDLIGPSCLVHSAFKMITDPTFTPMIADHAKIGKMVSGVKSIELPSSYISKSKGNGDDRTKTQTNKSKSEKMKSSPSREDLNQQLRDSKQKILMRLKPLVELAMKAQTNFIDIGKELTRNKQARMKGRRQLAMEDDLLSECDLDLMDSSPDSSDTESVDSDIVRMSTCKLQSCTSVNGNSGAVSKICDHGDDINMKEKKQRVRKEHSRPKKREAAKSPTTSALTQALLLGIKDLKKEENLDITDKPAEDMSEPSRDNSEKEMAKNSPKLRRKPHSGAKSSTPSILKGPPRNLMTYEEGIDQISQKLEKALSEAIKQESDAPLADDTKNKTNIYRKESEVKDSTVDKSFLNNNKRTTEKTTGSLAGEASHLVAMETATEEEKSNQASSDKTGDRLNGTEEQPSASGPSSSDGNSDDKTNRQKQLTSRAPQTSRSSHAWPYSLRKFPDSTFNRIIDVDIPNNKQCTYMAELWGDLWLVCPKDDVIAVFQHNGEYRCCIAVNPTVYEPMAIAQASPTEAFILAKDGLFIMDISNEKDMFRRLSSGSFRSICVSNGDLYTLLQTEAKILIFRFDGSVWDSSSSIQLDSNKDLAVLDSMCVVANYVYVLNCASQTLYKYSMSGSMITEYAYHQKCLANDLVICGHTDHMLILCTEEEGGLFIFDNSIDLVPIQLMDVNNPRYVIHGRKKTFWVLHNKGRKLTKIAYDNKSKKK